ncbi:hypothetical protein BDY24DRAFT_210009 [Mrakia frigida]|uniref:uncharacterized protein n=1 Tax=Mrakia frigida TaxID=29902 RepID=UPI003FCC0EFB
MAKTNLGVDPRSLVSHQVSPRPPRSRSWDASRPCTIGLPRSDDFLHRVFYRVELDDHQILRQGKGGHSFCDLALSPPSHHSSKSKHLPRSQQGLNDALSLFFLLAELGRSLSSRLAACRPVRREGGPRFRLRTRTPSPRRRRGQSRGLIDASAFPPRCLFLSLSQSLFSPRSFLACCDSLSSFSVYNYCSILLI